jgi:hypothetical protein
MVTTALTRIGQASLDGTTFGWVLLVIVPSAALGLLVRRWWVLGFPAVAFLALVFGLQDPDMTDQELLWACFRWTLLPALGAAMAGVLIGRVVRPRASRRE